MIILAKNKTKHTHARRRAEPFRQFVFSRQETKLDKFLSTDQRNHANCSTSKRTVLEVKKKQWQKRMEIPSFSEALSIFDRSTMQCFSEEHDYTRIRWDLAFLPKFGMENWVKTVTIYWDTSDYHIGIAVNLGLLAGEGGAVPLVQVTWPAVSSAGDRSPWQSRFTSASEGCPCHCCELITIYIRHSILTIM